MTVSLADLHALGFVTTHEIRLSPDADGLRFVRVTEASPVGACVYVWLALRAAGADGAAMYVGKAGKGIEKRNTEHAGGFIRNGTGRKNAKALAKVLSDPEMRVAVMARPSATAELFGFRVSLYAAEEDALCRALRPTLNRAKFPAAKADAVPAPPQATAHPVEGLGISP